MKLIKKLDNSRILKQDAIYMHSYRFGEKIDNIKRNSNTGFEVDQHLAFLPSYYFHPSDASQADTLYKSVVIKGQSYIIEDNEEKTIALNSLMEKYQPEGNYEKLNSKMYSVQEVTVIKLIPNHMKGKYKIGQQWTTSYRLKIAEKILTREKENAKLIFQEMGIEILEDKKLIILSTYLKCEHNISNNPTVFSKLIKIVCIFWHHFIFQ